MYDHPRVIVLEPISALWPSIVVTLVLTVYRLSINRLFQSFAIYYANQQILKVKAKFLLQMFDCYESESVHKMTPRHTNNHSLRRRNIDESSKIPDASSHQQLETEFDAYCQK